MWQRLKAFERLSQAEVRNAFDLDLQAELHRPNLGAALRSQAPEAGLLFASSHMF